MREGKRRGLLRSCATALEGGQSCGSSDDLGEALGMLDVAHEFGLQGFVHDSERNEALRPLGLRSGTTALRFCLALAAHGQNAP